LPDEGSMQSAGVRLWIVPRNKACCLPNLGPPAPKLFHSLPM